ncbi:hypothetical protein WD019_11680 [Fictibacillus sp. Mic-4]|uniref:hypothetical protein n=1 Tax=Fictibacillus sp. Mic-4 TaxID=3132826 RepID=UPI003CEE53EF
MKEKIVNEIQNLFHNADFGHVLLNYVDTDIWFKKISSHLNGPYLIENLTDFNYSRCFTTFLFREFESEIKLWTDDFKEYVKQRSYVEGLAIYISVIAPYSSIIPFRYEYINGEIKMKELGNSSNKTLVSAKQEILKLLNREGIQILDKEILEIKIPNISLELYEDEDEVSIFNCLFE